MAKEKGEYTSDLVKVRAVHTYRSTGKLVNQSDDMVNLTVTMPKWYWDKNCKYMGVDKYGKPLGEDD